MAENQAIAYYETRAPLTKLEKRVVEQLLVGFDQLPSNPKNIQTQNVTQTRHPESSRPCLRESSKSGGHSCAPEIQDAQHSANVDGPPHLRSASFENTVNISLRYSSPQGHATSNEELTAKTWLPSTSASPKANVVETQDTLELLQDDAVDSASRSVETDLPGKIAFQKSDALLGATKPAVKGPVFYTNNVVTSPSQYKKTYPVASRIMSMSG